MTELWHKCAVFGPVCIFSEGNKYLFSLNMFKKAKFVLICLPGGSSTIYGVLMALLFEGPTLDDLVLDLRRPY